MGCDRAIVGLILLANMLSGCSSQPILPLRQFPGSGGPVTAVCWSTDSQYIASSGADGGVRVWRVSNGAQVAATQGCGRPYSYDSMGGIAFSPDAQRLAFGRSNGEIVVWNWAAPTLERQTTQVLRAHKSAVTAIAFSRDGRFVTSVSGGRTAAEPRFEPYDAVVTHDLHSSNIVSSIEDLKPVGNVVLFPTGDRFAVMVVGTPPMVSGTGEVQVRDSRTGRIIWRLEVCPAMTGLNMFVSQDATKLFVANSVWNAGTGESMYRPAYGSVFADGGRSLVSWEQNVRPGTLPNTQIETARFGTYDLETGGERAGRWSHDYNDIEHLVQEIYSPDRNFVIDRKMHLWPLRR